MRRCGDAGPRRGTLAVELALSLPLVMTMLLGLWEVGRMAQVRQLLLSAAREGGRQASTSQLTNAEVRQVVIDYLKGVGLKTDNVAVTVTNATQPGVDAINAAQLDRLEVALTIPYKDVQMIKASVLSGVSANLGAKSVWYSMKDKPYPAPPEPPIE